MDAAIIFALTLSAIFFGCIIWLVIHSQRQEREEKEKTLEQKNHTPAPQIRKRTSPRLGERSSPSLP